MKGQFFIYMLLDEFSNTQIQALIYTYIDNSIHISQRKYSVYSMMENGSGFAHAYLFLHFVTAT